MRFFSWVGNFAINVMLAVLGTLLAATILAWIELNIVSRRAEVNR